jgi:hypothetical protein
MTNGGCLRCNGSLEPGFLIDRTHMGFTAQAMWASGDPQPTALLAVSVVASQSDTRNVVTYRCVDCGRLESFAP